MAQPCWLRLGMVWRWLLNKFVLGVEGQGRSRGGMLPHSRNLILSCRAVLWFIRGVVALT